MFQTSNSKKSPKSLVQISTEFICDHLNQVFDRRIDGFCLEDGMVLPREICELIFDEYQRSGCSYDDEFANIFADKRRTALKKVAIWHSSITDDSFRKIVQHNLCELDIAYCRWLTPLSLDLINEYGQNLKVLSLGNRVAICGKSVISSNRGYFFNTPNLTRLTFKKEFCRCPPIFYQKLLQNLTNLTYLDLSYCNDLGNLSGINLNCPNLTSLLLFNCANLYRAIPSICELTKLKLLDLSQSEEGHGLYDKENQVLKNIIESLPNLVSLDISGTNLAGNGSVEENLLDQTERYHSDIPGLAGRVSNPLEFLGLYGTLHGACKRHNIPARKISGHATEDQLRTASIVYKNRSEMLQLIFNDVFQVLQTGEQTDSITETLRIISDGLNACMLEKVIQNYGKFGRL